MTDRPPVSDWTTDWDHLDDKWRNDPYPIWDELRKTCPIAYTKRFSGEVLDGAYLPTRYEDVKTIAYDTEHFSSRRVMVRADPPPLDRLLTSPPITTDPPDHKRAKQVLLPFFSANEMTRIEPKARAICNELIDTFVATGRCDAAQQYARHIPVRVIAHMLGVSDDMGPQFIKWIHEMLELGITDESIFLRATMEMTQYFTEEVAKRKDNPTDDLINVMMRGDRNGVAFTDEHVVGTLRLLMVAGIDTTWSGIGASLWHLANSPADRRRLIEEPELLPLAIEEFLRAFSPVTMAREVVADTEVGGCPMKAGNMVLLSFPAANRDPDMFEDAGRVVIDRQKNRHAAFGLGAHRCVGSNLARMEMTVAIEEFLKRVPEFAVDGDVSWSEGTVRGPRALPLVFG